MFSVPPPSTVPFVSSSYSFSLPSSEPVTAPKPENEKENEYDLRTSGRRPSA